MSTENKYVNVIENITKEINNYLIESNVDSVVLGISGGIDSAIVAALFHHICQLTGVKLIGKSIPIATNKPDEIMRAKLVGNAFCDEFEEIDLTDAYNNFVTIFPGLSEDESYDAKIRKGNIKARIRMIYLYDTARANNGFVLSTDNLTEYRLGFWTLHGDVGDYSVIQNLTKTEVYAVSNKMLRVLNAEQRLALQSCITAIPTDGLGITASDMDQIGCENYIHVDYIFHKYLELGDASVKDHPVIQRYLKSWYKRNNPKMLSREDVGLDPFKIVR